MKPVAAIAIVLGLVAAPGWGQRGASHSGFAGHSAPVGHSAPGGNQPPVSRMAPIAPFGHSGPIGRPAPMGYSPIGRAAPPAGGGQFSPGRGPNSMRFGGPSQASHSRLPYNGSEHTGTRRSGWGQGDRDHGGDHDRGGGRDHHRQPYWRGYGPVLNYAYLGWPGYPFLWNSAPLFGNDAATFNDYDAPDGAGNQIPYGDESSAQQYPGYPAAPDQAAGYIASDAGLQQSARPEYTGSVPSTNSADPEQAVTVIFNDGRPSEQIQNYLLTSTTLTVLDRKYREIPLDQINLAATQQTNRADGIDFRVPEVTR